VLVSIETPTSEYVAFMLRPEKSVTAVPVTTSFDLKSCSSALKLLVPVLVLTQRLINQMPVS
jgi:hypothetical protein